MFSRRELVTGGLAAVTASRAADLSAGTVQSLDDNTAILTDMAATLQRMAAPRPVPGAFAIELVRQSQRAFLKQAGKFPDQIDVGLDIWDAVIDWHVATRQPVQVSRHADSRYAIRYLTTSIVLKHELPENYVGQGQ
jgi:hypothetical protein